MKRLIIFFLVVVCFVVAIENNRTNFSFYNYFKNYEIITYTNEHVNETSIKNGAMYMTPNCSDVSTKILGESFVISADQFDNIFSKLNCKAVKTETFNDFLIIYAYTPFNRNGVYIENEKINVQIVIKNTNMTVGWPLILGSF